MKGGERIGGGGGGGGEGSGADLSESTIDPAVRQGSANSATGRATHQTPCHSGHHLCVVMPRLYRWKK